MTYSIVGRDPETGQLGVAVQSHWFSVGSIVPWAAPGVGAVATQANAETSYGPRALELLGKGMSAPEALAELISQDASAASRQVAVIDSAGRVAAHTGGECIPFAGHSVGENASCQANIMASQEVWPAMLAAFQAAPGSLAARLLDALDAAERAGGDLRGRQSAALLVVPANGAPWEAAVSLRVEDHPEPLAELRRLTEVHEAYRLAAAADALVGQGRHDEAADLYRQASDLAPDNHELRLWAALGAAQRGNMPLAVSQARAAIDAHSPWLDLLRRLPGEVAPSAAALVSELEDNRPSGTV